MSVDPTLWPLLLGVVAALILGVLVSTTVARALRRRQGRRHQRGGQRAERRAERLLTRAGYTIVERQPQAQWVILVDGRPVQVRSRADLLVRRKGLRFIAEVKAGRHGASPTTAATRRQLLEYAQAFDVHGVVLVDMRHCRIHTVAFPVTDVGERAHIG